MQVIDLSRLSSDGKEYFTIILDLETKEYFMIKNASCSAIINDFLQEKYEIPYSYMVNNRFKTFFNNNDDFINLDNIYKKYHKYFT